MKMKQVYTEADVEQVVREVVRPRVTPGVIITLEGQLGAGKTTLVRALLGGMGVWGEITSPTFSYVNTYSVNDQVIHHFDLYRLSTADEFCQAGFEEYLADEHAVIFIEWPEVIASVLARFPRVIQIGLSYDPTNLSQRILKLSE
jgi:tRNA threonylcarbamoyladenosine biosynthesis protein TsaE